MIDRLIAPVYLLREGPMKPRFIHIGSWNIEHFGRDDDNPSNQGLAGPS